MTTFTTEDRIIAEKDGSFTVNVSPPHVVDSGASVQTKDLTIPGFVFRFVRNGDEWVCTMPEWLLNEAMGVASGLVHENK